MWHTSTQCAGNPKGSIKGQEVTLQCMQWKKIMIGPAVCGHSPSAADTDEWKCAMMVEGSNLTLPMKINTGADCNVISMEEYHSVSEATQTKHLCIAKRHSQKMLSAPWGMKCTQVQRFFTELFCKQPCLCSVAYWKINILVSLLNQSGWSDLD